MKKPLGGYRSIAVGDTLHRLAAKCQLTNAMGGIFEYLLPVQDGVGVPKTVARKVRLWTRQDGADEMVMQIDLKNAFNSIDRSKLLAEIKARTPLLYPYASACYSVVGRNPGCPARRRSWTCLFCCRHLLDRPQTGRSGSAVSVLVLG